MSIENGETTFNLSRPLKYSRGGNSQVETTTVILLEPGMEHAKYYLRLKQMLIRCQMEFAKQAGELKAIGEQQKALHQDTARIENENDDLFEMFSILVMASETVDVSKFLEIFQEMATLRGAQKSICRLDAGQPMTGPLWDKLTPDDAYNMAVRWCVNFGMPSDGSGKTISDRQSGSPMEPMEA